MTGHVLNRFKQQVSELKLIPARGGCFEVKIDDELIYSKLAVGRFPNEADIVAEIQTRLAAKK